MQRIAIVEDNPKTADQLQDYVKRVAETAHTLLETEVFFTAEDFLKRPSSRYAMVCMDIELPGMNGMDAAQALRKQDEKIGILFITNMGQYAVRGYAVQALDYILKPVRYQDFADKLIRSLKRLERAGQRGIVLDTVDGLVRLPLTELYSIRVDGHKIIFETEQGAFLKRGSSMKQMEREFLPYGFIRISTERMVNLRCICGIREKEVTVGRITIPISRGKKRELVQALAELFGSEEN